ncbi:S8 family serine peptidase [Burkholderia sp. 22PA0099]|uniref:S8 family serine peptidase n=1 Tax=Burkholderia sp. 22PA0099 TaxID=3237372 RepID=UPI0039C39F57
MTKVSKSVRAAINKKNSFQEKTKKIAHSKILHYGYPREKRRVKLLDTFGIEIGLNLPNIIYPHSTTASPESNPPLILKQGDLLKTINHSTITQPLPQIKNIAIIEHPERRNTVHNKTKYEIKITPSPGIYRIPREIQYAPGLDLFVENSITLSERARELSQNLIVSITTQTTSGRLLSDAVGPDELNTSNVDQYRLAPDMAEKTAELLRQKGFDVIAMTEFALFVQASPAKVASLIAKPLFLHASSDSSWARGFNGGSSNFAPPKPDQLFIAPEDGPVVRISDSDLNIQEVFFHFPTEYFHTSTPSASPPAVSYFNIGENEIRNALNVPTTFAGNGIKVAVVDSGFHKHPFYKNLKYYPTATSLEKKPTEDLDGHGTAITSNVFAVAPKVEVYGFPRRNPPSLSFSEAATSGADIISCSWGMKGNLIDTLLMASILSAINNGKIVLFAAGNGHRGWPGSMDEVLSIGGVYQDANGNLTASDFASGYAATSTRTVPDFCGLCGMKPKGIYIMMPTQPLSAMDIANQNLKFPDGDETGAGSGWVGASGTSSATPMIAGVVALLLEKAKSLNKTLTQNDVRKILSQSAQPVSVGKSAMGHQATSAVPNLAVGYGLVDATAALALV